jgi:hypothetical protein
MRGFGLIETLVAIAVTSLLMVSMLSVVSSLSTTVSRFENITQANMSNNATSSALSYPGSCDFNLKSPNFSSLAFNKSSSTASISITKLEIPTPTTPSLLLQLNMTAAPQLYVKAITLKDFVQIGATNNFVSNVYVVYSNQPTTSSLPTTQIFQRKFPLNLAVSIAGSTATITNCSTGPLAAAMTGAEIFPGWPNGLICSGYLWPIMAPGRYHFFLGGESTTRSSIANFDLTTQEPTSCNNGGSMGCGICATDSIAELKAAGYAK